MTDSNNANATPAPRKKSKDPLLSDPRHVLAAARQAKAEGQGISRALTLFRAYDPERYAEAKGYDSAWFTNRLVYYRQNKEWRQYTPDFGVAVPKQLTLDALEEVLALERKANGGELLLPPRGAEEPKAEEPVTTEPEAVGIRDDSEERAIESTNKPPSPKASAASAAPQNKAKASTQAEQPKTRGALAVVAKKAGKR